MAGIPMDKRDGWIWLDGEFVPWQEANCHILSHGLHYASSVFEGQRAYQGKIFKLAEHIERLRFSANTLDFDLPYTNAELAEACKAAIVKNNLTNAYMRPVAWRGAETLSVSAQNSTTHVAIAAWEWPSYFSKEDKMKGLRLRLAQWRRPAPECAPVHAKAAGLYMIATLSKHKAEAAGYHDALMLDYRGYVAECTGANLFCVTKDGQIHTPIADCFLNGITRRTVIQLARDAGYTVEERRIMPEDLGDYAEVFVTGSAAEVTPIGEISMSDALTHRYTPASVTQSIDTLYMKAVGAA